LTKNCANYFTTCQFAHRFTPLFMGCY